MDPRPNQHQLSSTQTALIPFPATASGSCQKLYIASLRLLSQTQTLRWFAFGVYAIRYLVPINNLFTFLSSRLPAFNAGDPYRIRTDVNGVRGRCLNHLTNGPSSARTSYRSPRRMRHVSFTPSRLLFLAQTLRWFALRRGNGDFSLSETSAFTNEFCLVHHQGLEPWTP